MFNGEKTNGIVKNNHNQTLKRAVAAATLAGIILTGGLLGTFKNVSNTPKTDNLEASQKDERRDYERRIYLLKKEVKSLEEKNAALKKALKEGGGFYFDPEEYPLDENLKNITDELNAKGIGNNNGQMALLARAVKELSAYNRILADKIIQFETGADLSM